MNIPLEKCTGLCSDSRICEPGNIFFAISGAKDDGVRYAQQALDKGAIAVVASQESQLENAVLVDNVRSCLAESAHKFYGQPSKKLKLVAVTGTNGKTSVAWLLNEALKSLGKDSRYLGTLGNAGPDGPPTTPDAVSLNKTLASFAADSCEYVCLEVSSHALDQSRTEYLDIDLAIFTNLSRDHLDYHKSEENYAAAKRLLFSRELKNSSKLNKAAVINVDDNLAEQLTGFADADFMYGSDGDVKLLSASYSSVGSELSLSMREQEVDVKTQLLGEYNSKNIMAVASSLLALGYSIEEIKSALETLPPVPGRMESVETGKPVVLVDYAHTPDALENLLKSVRVFCRGKIICVFGCGGDRDVGKRPQMAAVVDRLADFAILTSDNPRSEKPEAILEDVIKGFSSESYVTEVDRASAIKLAISKASDEDIVVIAGKGHEEYQEINGDRIEFSDVEITKQVLNG